MSGGYKSLLVYRLALTIYDGTISFCNRWVNKKSRTYDQMIQAARSGKQNIGEGSKELSASSDILLNSVSRSSYTELSEDFEDFLRQKGLPVWDKNDPRVLKIRAFKEVIGQPTNLTNLANWTNLFFYQKLAFCFINLYTMLLEPKESGGPRRVNPRKKNVGAEFTINLSG